MNDRRRERRSYKMATGSYVSAHQAAVVKPASSRRATLCSRCKLRLSYVARFLPAVWRRVKSPPHTDFNLRPPTTREKEGERDSASETKNCSVCARVSRERARHRRTSDEPYLVNLIKCDIASATKLLARDVNAKFAILCDCSPLFIVVLYNSHI